MAGKDPKNSFYRLLKLDDYFWKLLKEYRKIKKEMLKDCSKNLSK